MELAKGVGFQGPQPRAPDTGGQGPCCVRGHDGSEILYGSGGQGLVSIRGPRTLLRPLNVAPFMKKKLWASCKGGWAQWASGADHKVRKGGEAPKGPVGVLSIKKSRGSYSRNPPPPPPPSVPSNPQTHTNPLLHPFSLNSVPCSFDDRNSWLPKRLRFI